MDASASNKEGSFWTEDDACWDYYSVGVPYSSILYEA